MAYQIIPVADSDKEGIVDFTSRGAVWDDTNYTQGLRFLNNGKVLLIARSAIAATHHYATWSTAQAQAGEYSALLTKLATDADCSTHLDITPTTTITLNDLAEAIDDAAPEWSFYHYDSAVAANFTQLELLFEDTASQVRGPGHGYLELTLVPLQGITGGAAWTQCTIDSATPFGYGGHTPDGSSVFEWGAPLPTLTDLLTTVNAAWAAAETGEVATNYVLTRIRFELWEDAPARTSYIDTVVIDGTAYAIEPGVAGAKLGLNTPGTTLAFVDIKDRYGRLETLSPVVGAGQSLCVGPLLPALFNDTEGYVKFLPSAHPAAPATVFYTALRVGNAG